MRHGGSVAPVIVVADVAEGWGAIHAPTRPEALIHTRRVGYHSRYLLVLTSQKHILLVGLRQQA